MKKILLALLCMPSIALAAQQEITAVPDSPVLPSIGALKDAVNLRLADIDENFDEIYPIIEAGPVYVNASAPADTKVVWIDTDQDNAIKVHVGGVWTVVGTAGEGSYTLPTAAADTLGGVKVGARLTITDGVLSADVQTPSGSATYPSAAGVANWGGSAWGTSYTVGTAADNLVQLNASAQLPAVSGAQLTGSFTGTLIGSQTTLSGAIQTIGTELDGQDELLFDSGDFTETAGTGTVTVSIDKSAVEATQPSTLALTTDTSITEANLLSSKYLSNYGASGEVNIILPAISYNQTRTILIEAAQVLEIFPPSGEVLDVKGTDMTCVNSGSVVGNRATATRLRIGASTWKWSIDVVRGAWDPCGAASD
jgi:hypothetical protein